ncbi:MAG: TMEM165/GDT1 family protein, partial [Thiomonas sp.]
DDTQGRTKMYESIVKGDHIIEVVVFFLAEMGDKTQVATVALAARYQEWFAVVAGTTLGMMLANVPAILFGHRFADRLPTRLVHGIAALIFVVMGAYSLHKALTA